MLAALVLLLPSVRAAPHPSGGYGGLGYHNAPEPAPLSNASSGADAVRRLQASARPDKCNDDASYQAWLDVVNQACCARASSPCTNGLPSSCDLSCANVLSPVRAPLLFRPDTYLRRVC